MGHKSGSVSAPGSSGVALGFGRPSLGRPGSPEFRPKCAERSTTGRKRHSLGSRALYGGDARRQMQGHPENDRSPLIRKKGQAETFFAGWGEASDVPRYLLTECGQPQTQWRFTLYAVR